MTAFENVTVIRCDGPLQGVPCLVGAVEFSTYPDVGGLRSHLAVQGWSWTNEPGEPMTDHCPQCRNDTA
ncbi:hypothetical protein ACQP2Y_21040 [Actinoplanes sp. CA-051413]|uniref:hypothetical protein n=1 Tax=Actinoplanes sp. CA-051413 TaxID=3239899 RepID=UPI003D974B28